MNNKIEKIPILNTKIEKLISHKTSDGNIFDTKETNQKSLGMWRKLQERKPLLKRLF